MKMNFILILTFFINASRASKSNTPKIIFHQLGHWFRVSPAIHDPTISDPKETLLSREGLELIEDLLNEQTQTWIKVIESVAEQNSKIFSNLKLMFDKDHGNHR